MTEPRRADLQSYAALSLGILSLGCSGIFIRWAHVPGVVTSLYRIAVAVVVLAPLFARRVRAAGSIPTGGWRTALLGGVLFAGDVALWATGVVLSGATNSTLLAIGHLPASLVAPPLLGQPVVTALLAGPLLGETFSAGHIVGGAAVLTGVYIVHRSRRSATVEA